MAIKKSATFKTAAKEEEGEEEELKALERALNTRKVGGGGGGHLLACRRCGRVPEDKPDYIDVIRQEV